MNLSRLSASAIVAVLAFATAGSAEAQIARPKLKVVDRGDKVEVVVSDVRLPAAPSMKVNRERIDLPLAGRPNEVNEVYGTGLVMRIDVRTEGTTRMMSVKLRRDHDAVVALAQGATATQGDDGVHLIVPKTALAAAAPAATAPAAPAVENAAATGATATLEAAPAKTAAAAPATATTGTSVTLGGVTAPTVDTNANNANASNTNANSANANSANASNTNANNANANPANAHDVNATANSANANDANANTDGSNALAGLTGRHTGAEAKSSNSKLTGGGSGPGIGRVVLAIAAIALAGGAIVALRRRKGAAPTAPGPQLDVLASKSLGGKTRIVWLGAGDRELVVAVANTSVSLLGQWRRGEADRATERSTPMRLETGRDDADPSFASGSVQLPRTRTLNTSAVSGIMRLRGKVTPITDDLPTDDGDADEKWARDILAATGGRR